MFSAPESSAIRPSKPARQSTYQEAQPVPFANGFFRLAPKWITDRFNDHWSNGSQTGQAFCSVAGILCHGPIKQFRSIITAGDTVVLFDYVRPDDPGDPNYYSVPFEFGGTDKQVGITNKGRLYWGREDQPADEWLRTTTGQNHSAMRGLCYVVFERIHCGQIQANSNARPPLPAIEFSLIRLPSPTIPAGLQIPSTLESSKLRGVNLVSALYDVLTHSRGGLGLVGALDDADWIAKAQALENGTKPAGGVSGDLLWISPIHAGDDEGEKIVTDYLSYIDGFLYTRDGKLRIDWFPNDGTIPTDIPEISHHDLVEVLEFNTATFADAPTQIVVSGLEALPNDGAELTDAAEQAQVPFVREITGGENRVEKLDRPWFTHRDALAAYARRVASSRTVPAQNGKFVALPSRAVRLDGSPLRPGDLVRLNWQPLQLLIIARITERMDAMGGVQLTWERERGITPLPYTAATDPRSDYTLPTPTKPEATDWAVLAAPSGLAGLGAVVFCRRVQNTLSGLRVHFDPVGDWGAAATQLGEQGFAVRVALGSGISDTDGSVTVISTDTDASGVIASGANSTEQENDALILVVGDEWTSVGAATSSAPDTYSLDIARGRLGSTAAAHSIGDYGWLIRRDRLVVWENALFIGGDVGHFKVQTYHSLSDSPVSDAKDVTFVENPGWTTAKLVVLTSDAQTFQLAKDGTITPTSITFTVTGQNVFGVPEFTVSSGTATLTGSGATRSLAPADMTTDAITVKVVWDGQEDYLSVVKVREGTDSIVALLSNESHTVPADKDGNVTSWSGASTNIKVFRGITDDTSNWTFGKSETNLAGTLVGNVYTASGMSADVGYVDITASRTGFASVTKRFTVTKSKTGATGATGSTGPAGSTGNAVERRYIRSTLVPPTPTGDNPISWTVAIPSGSDALWVSEAVKDSLGHVVGSWSSPQRLTGNVVFYKTSAPSTGSHTLIEGDLWFDTDDGNRPYRWENPGSGYQWVAKPFGDAAIANLAAGKITTGTLEAAVSIGTLGTLTAGSGANRFSVSSSGAVFGDPSGEHFVIENSGGATVLFGKTGGLYSGTQIDVYGVSSQLTYGYQVQGAYFYASTQLECYGFRALNDAQFDGDIRLGYSGTERWIYDSNGNRILRARYSGTPATLADVIAVLQHHGLSN